jgi:rubredoxin
MSGDGEHGTSDRAASPATAYECGVCWTVYDPALGDPYAQVAPGTPFALLPAHWLCPHCEAPKSRFLALDE